MFLIDVCAGAGGLSLGAQDAGFEVLGVERDLIAAAWHEGNVGPCELSDIRFWSPPRSADVVAGGVPCQSFSHAGNRGGTDDPRGRLFLELLRIAREAGARACVLENVPGLTSSKGGADFALILAAFRGAGFVHLHHKILNASSFGVPQHRKRLFVVGFREPLPFAWPAPTHGPGLLPFETVGSALGLVSATQGCVTSIRCSLLRQSGGVNAQDLIRAGLLDRPSTAVQAQSGGKISRAGHRSFAPGGESMFVGGVRLSPEQCSILQDFPRDARWPSARCDAYRLIGNAVPRRLGAAVLRSVRRALG